MKLTKFKHKLLISLVLGSFYVVVQANPADLLNAKDLIKAGKAKEAYELLIPLEDELAADAQYNYLLGISALDSQKPGKAVFALERATAIEPNNAEYRAELARAYYDLGEKTTAKAEFEQVLSTNPPEAAKATINRYLAAINAPPKYKTNFNAHINYAFGHDSNINSATANSSIAIPFFGGQVFNLVKGGSELHDTFNMIDLGAGFASPLGNGFSLLGSASHAQRLNSNNIAFDTGSTNASLGMAKDFERSTLSASYNDNHLSLNDNSFRNAYGVNVQFQSDIGTNKQLTVYTQLSRIHFPNENSRDADRYIVGAGFAQLFEGAYKPVGFLGVYGGKEDAQKSGFNYVGFDVFGLRAGGQLSINDKLATYLSMSFENREHNGTDPFFLLTRHDKQYDVNLGVSYKLVPSFSIVPSISYTKNSTNYTLSEYDRTVGMVNFRKEFDW